MLKDQTFSFKEQALQEKKLSTAIIHSVSSIGGIESTSKNKNEFTNAICFVKQSKENIPASR